MSKSSIPFSAFVEAAGPSHSEFINRLHQYLLSHQCSVEIKEAKSGYVVSYLHPSDKRVLANYVFRKKGPMLRIYASHIASYMECLEEWPTAMKAAVKKAPSCKRLIDPEACNPRCSMGFDFLMDGERFQTCRYSGFTFFLEKETNPYLQDMMEREVMARAR